MPKYRVKNNDFLDPFNAESDEKASQIALNHLGFGYGTAKKVANTSAINVLAELDFEIEKIGN